MFTNVARYFALGQLDQGGGGLVALVRGGGVAKTACSATLFVWEIVCRQLETIDPCGSRTPARTIVSDGLAGSASAVGQYNNNNNATHGFVASDTSAVGQKAKRIKHHGVLYKGAASPHSLTFVYLVVLSRRVSFGQRSTVRLCTLVQAGGWKGLKSSEKNLH